MTGPARWPTLVLRACVLAAAALGLLALVGWLAGVPALRSVFPGHTDVKFNTALSLVALSAALLVPWRGARVALAGAVAALALATLVQTPTGIDLGIDELVVPETDPLWPHPGRMAANTGLALAFLAAAVALDRWRPRLAEGLGLAAGAISFAGLIGYATGVDDFTGIGAFRMALATAIAVTLLVVALVLDHPRHLLRSLLVSPTPSGRVARTLVPVVVGLPFLMAAAREGSELAGLGERTVGWVVSIAEVAWFFVFVALVLRSIRGLDDLRSRITERVAGHAIYLISPDGLVQTWGANAEALTGYASAEVVGQRWDLIVEDKRASADLLRQAAASGSVDHEGWRVRKDGSRFWGLGTLTALRDGRGRIEGYVKITRDLSERERAADQVRESEARYRLLAENSTDMITVTDKDKRFTFVSPASRTLLGYEPAELLGRRGSEFLHPEDLADYAAKRAAVVQRAGPERITLRMRRKDGSYVWIESISRAHPSDPGSVVSAVRDITDRKAAEDEVHRVNAGLEATVAARTKALTDAVTELEAFSYSVSHDLRAPLRAIDGFSKALVDEQGDKLPAEARDDLARIRAATKRMGSLIDDILKLSRISRAELRAEPVDLSAIASELLSDLQRQEPTRVVETHVAPGLVARGDPVLLRAVLQNHLENAWKFTSKHKTATIEVGSMRTPDATAFFVRDDGAGFDPQYADKLFGAFQRLHRADEFPGNGIGLATVRRIVARHGGRTWAEGQPEKGATFYFTIPGQ